MESLKGIISDIHVFLYGGILTLPLTIAGTMLILGLFTANYAILFFLLGYLILAPSTAQLLNFIAGGIFEGKGYNPFRATTTDICRVNIPYTTLKNAVGKSDETVISSPWVAMISFFIGYIFTNAIKLYSRESPDTSISSSIESKVESRKTQAMVAMGSIIIFALIVLGFRYYTGCESTLGMLITTLIYIFMGNGWYYALAGVGQDRLSDLFGIANRLLPPNALKNAPIACVPIRS
jgi:hypothetical protein